MMAAIAISRDDVIDAEFETLAPATLRVNASQFKPKTVSSFQSDAETAQLDLLRKPIDPENAGSHPDGLTPSFLLFTLLAAFAVFWVSGGRTLLY